MQDGGDDPKDGVAAGAGQTDGAHGGRRDVELLGVVQVLDTEALGCFEVQVVLGLLQVERQPHAAGRGEKLVEDVEVALPVPRLDNAAFLVQKVRHLAAQRPPEAIELELEVLAEAGGVVVAERLSVAEGLKDGVGLEEDLLHGVNGRLAAGRRHGCDVVLSCQADMCEQRWEKKKKGEWGARASIVAL